jgi:lipopolysaccharide/colanic/teichoic acid biosynthesis glycosyltransferase
MVKRIFDLLIAIVGLILLSPVLLLVSLLIKLDSPGSIFYKGDRIGKDGVPFKMYKFRTMVTNADRLGPALTHRGDPRITRVGRKLRQWKLDEIPQIFNIIRGEMSVVGPRPESPGYVQHYTPQQRRVLQVKPGITGLTQVKFRHEESLLDHCTHVEADYLEKIMPHKLALDLEYINSQSLLVDIKLMIRTVWCLFQADEYAHEK